MFTKVITEVIIKEKTTATEWLTKSEKKSLPALAKVQGRFFYFSDKSNV